MSEAVESSWSSERTLLGSLGLGSVPQTVLANVGIAALNMVGSVLVARLLGPEGKGAVAAIVIWPQLIHAAGFVSLNEAVTFRMASQSGPGLPTARAGMVAAGVLSILPVAACILLAPHLLGAARRNLWTSTQVYGAILIPISSVFLVLLAVQQGLGRFSRYNLLRLLQPIVYVSVLVGAALVDRASISLVLAAAIAAVFLPATFQMRALSRRLWGGLRRSDTFVEGIALVRQGLRFHALTVLLSLSLMLDRMLAVGLFNNRSVGLFTVAASVTVVPLAAVGGGFSRVLFPKQAHWGGSALNTIVIRGLLAAGLILALLGLGAALIAGHAVPILFGPRFEAAVKIVPILAAVAVASAWRQVVEQTLRGGQLTRVAVASEAAMILVTIGVGVSLAPSTGLRGLAWALLAGNVTGLSVLGVWARRIHR